LAEVGGRWHLKKLLRSLNGVKKNELQWPCLMLFYILALRAFAAPVRRNMFDHPLLKDEQIDEDDWHQMMIIVADDNPPRVVRPKSCQSALYSPIGHCMLMPMPDGMVVQLGLLNGELPSRQQWHHLKVHLMQLTQIECSYCFHFLFEKV
jgi:hypothetical protein